MHSKLIVALDFDNRSDAMSLVDALEPSQCALKVGSELFTLLGPDFVRELVNRHFNVFLDLKFHDIPNTVARACHVAAELGVWMINVHASGGLPMMQAAKAALADFPHPPILIAVTVLTSMNLDVLKTLGVSVPVEAHVLHLAALAKEAGLDGVVCSAQESALIKAHCGHDFLTVTPGIRLLLEQADDQSRIVTPEDAIRAGSDFIVVGRSITRSGNPKQVIADILTSCQRL